MFENQTDTGSKPPRKRYGQVAWPLSTMSSIKLTVSGTGAESAARHHTVTSGWVFTDYNTSGSACRACTVAVHRARLAVYWNQAGDANISLFTFLKYFCLEYCWTDLTSVRLQKLWFPTIVVIIQNVPFDQISPLPLFRLKVQKILWRVPNNSITTIDTADKRGLPFSSRTRFKFISYCVSFITDVAFWERNSLFWTLV